MTPDGPLPDGMFTKWSPWPARVKHARGCKAAVCVPVPGDRLPQIATIQWTAIASPHGRVQCYAWEPRTRTIVLGPSWWRTPIINR